MARWQRRARVLIALFAVAFAIVVGSTFKRRAAPPPAAPVDRVDPKAIVESEGGNVHRLKGSREDVTIAYDRLLTYADGSTKLVRATIVSTDRGGGRTFTVTGKDAQVGQNEATITLNGDVRLNASDGLTAKTEHATYTDSDGILSAPGPAEFARGRMRGSGLGMTYDKTRDVLWLLDQAVVHIAADEKGSGAAEIMSGTAGFARREKYVRFERGVTVHRAGQVIDADSATAFLTEDEKRIDRVELRGNTRITAASPDPGGLQALTGTNVNLKYAEDGQSLEHALIEGDAVLQLAGERGKAGRQISASTMDLGFAPDGSTPTALVARDGVQLTFPAEPGTPARTIRAMALDAKGEPGRGLTTAHFTGNVQYQEKSATVDRSARSAELEVGLKPGMSAMNEATFTHGVRFEDGSLAAMAASARYLVDQGVIELTGSEPPPGATTPRMSNEQIIINAKRIDLTLVGPKVKATGSVASVLQPPKKSAAGGSDAKVDTKLPSMLKQDQPVNITGDELAYDGVASKAIYTGNARLWQGGTSVKADEIAIDDKIGDLSASGSVTTVAVLEQVNKNQVKERVNSLATSKEFKYEESGHRATYTGDAHLSGPQGDMTAAKIELYLKPSGDELDHAEAYDSITLREQSRKTTGARMTYTAATEQYLVTGAPVTILDECNRETVGRKLTFVKATDTINVDGSGMRAQTKGGGTCPAK